jgi:STE20-like kinase
MFRDGLRQEMRLIKQEVDMMPKDKRKEVYKRRREEKEIEQAEKVRM